MKDADDYLAHVKALIIANPQVISWKIIREEAQGEEGLFRYQLTLQDGSLLEMFKRFQIENQRVQITKYSFHWQNASGQLLKRWDNAKHRPDIQTFPNHVHEGTDDHVKPSPAMNSEAILAIIQ